MAFLRLIRRMRRIARKRPSQSRRQPRPASRLQLPDNLLIDAILADPEFASLSDSARDETTSGWVDEVTAGDLVSPSQPATPLAGSERPNIPSSEDRTSPATSSSSSSDATESDLNFGAPLSQVPANNKVAEPPKMSRRRRFIGLFKSLSGLFRKKKSAHNASRDSQCPILGRSIDNNSSDQALYRDHSRDAEERANHAAALRLRTSEQQLAANLEYNDVLRNRNQVKAKEETEAADKSKPKISRPITTYQSLGREEKEERKAQEAWLAIAEQSMLEEEARERQQVEARESEEIQKAEREREEAEAQAHRDRKGKRPMTAEEFSEYEREVEEMRRRGFF